MKSNRYALIGAFLVGALLITAIGTALFFGGAFGKTKSRAIMVFRGNVTGLEVGTPVQFRGMKIGEVKRVRTIYNPKDQQVLFPVYAEFTGTIEVPGYEKSSDAPGVRDAWIRGMVEQGLHASLQTKSFVTGQQMIMLDFEEAKNPYFSRLEADILEIPTSRSSNETLVETFKELPVREMVIETRQMFNNINSLMVDAQGKPGPLPSLLKQITALSSQLDAHVPLLSKELAATASETRSTLASARNTLAGLDKTGVLISESVKSASNSFDGSTKEFAQVSQKVQASLGNVDQALLQALNRVDIALSKMDKTLGNVDRGIASTEKTLDQLGYVMSDDSQIGRGLARSLEEVAIAAKALRQSVDLINRKPNSLLTGNGHEK